MEAVCACNLPLVTNRAGVLRRPHLGRPALSHVKVDNPYRGTRHASADFWRRQIVFADVVGVGGQSQHKTRVAQPLAHLHVVLARAQVHRRERVALMRNSA